MPRTEVYQLRLTPHEKALLAKVAAHQGCSIAKLIRLRCGLEGDSTEAERSYPPRDIESRKADLTQRFKSQGYTTPVAERMARDALGLKT